MMEMYQIYRYLTIRAHYKIHPDFGSPVYIPTVVYLWFHIFAILNHLKMCIGFISFGNGMYVSPGTGKTVLYIGGMGSPNASCFYMHDVCIYIRKKYGSETRIIVYNPPEARLFVDINQYTSMEELMDECVDRLFSIDPWLVHANITIIGQSYGSILATILRKKCPVIDSSVCTELWDPVMFRRPHDFVHRCTNGILPWIPGRTVSVRGVIFSVGIRDIYILSGIMRVTKNLDADVETFRHLMGHVSYYIGEYDECIEDVRPVPGMHILKGLCHGDVAFNLPEIETPWKLETRQAGM
jgi:hypothetical protein